jgi:8-oxo-dGTP diphosphatase
MKSTESDETNASGTGYLPGIAIDAVIFGFHDKQLKVLLMEYKKTALFALPGGFVRKDENLDDAARQVVSIRTGLKDIFLDQFYVFGDAQRAEPEPMRKIMIANGIDPQENHWLLGRFISVGFYALVDFTKVVATPGEIFDGCAWYDLTNMPVLIQDHTFIVKKALEHLQKNLDSKLIGFNLLQEQFTMADLQSLYETVLSKKLQRTGFQRKMLSLNILERLEKKWTGGAHKAPYLYRFAKADGALI